jgi:hypothetical protein
MKDLFRKYETDFLQFDKVENKKSLRPDLHAFMLLDILVPGTSDMVSYASHDEIFLEVEPEALAKVATEDQLRELHRCGVRHDNDIGQDALVMFV